MIQINSKRKIAFLFHVFIHSLTAFGGPQAHINLLINRFATKRNFISSHEIMELNAFCAILPGPSSSQTITGIGYKIGGWPLAVITLLIWMLPSVIFMATLGLFFSFIQQKSLSFKIFIFIAPMAIGFFLSNALTFGKVVIKTGNSWVILIISTISAILIQSPILFPAIIAASIIISNFRHDNLLPYAFKLKLKWGNILVYFGIFFGIAILGSITKHLPPIINQPIVLFENFYRFGSLVFGGTQTLAPMMYEQYVVHKKLITSQEFLTGMGMVYAMPGPVFSIASYMGGMAMQHHGFYVQLLGSVIASIAIFLPGTLLLFFLFPLWNHLRQYPFIQRALAGINAASIGFALSGCVYFVRSIELSTINIFIIIGTFITLYFTKIAAPFVVITTLLLAFLYSYLM